MLHVGSVEGSLKLGDKVTCAIDGVSERETDSIGSLDPRPPPPPSCSLLAVQPHAGGSLGTRLLNRALTTILALGDYRMCTVKDSVVLETAML